MKKSCRIIPVSDLDLLSLSAPFSWRGVTSASKEESFRVFRDPAGASPRSVQPAPFSQISIPHDQTKAQSRDQRSLLPLEPFLGSLVALDERHELFRAGPVVLDDPVLVRSGHQLPVDHPRLDGHLCARVCKGESDLAGVGEERKEQGEAHHGQPLKAEPPPVTELPPRLDLLDDENTLEANAERAFFVKARFVRGDVPGKQRRVCR